MACPSLLELESFLDGTCADETLAQHVQTCPDCTRQIREMRDNNALMSRLTGSHLTGSASLETAAAAQAIPGYEIIRELHRGGQGIVYEARQQATRRVVAVKVLLAGAFATQQQQQRFEREVDLVAHLRHPNIVTVYDSGVTAEGRHWFAMEYIEGMTLDRVVRQGETDPGLPLPKLLELFASICAAVACAHQHGVIHRDLKPGNILVDPTGEPHVLDFGLAKPVNPRLEPEQPAVTIAGGFLGTIAYAAPEQTSGEPHQSDVRSDVYSLGIMLYELLTGRYPYPVTGSLAEVLDHIAHWPALPPRTVRPSRYRIDDELETITLKALAKEPARRYQSAVELRRDLEYYLAGAPIDAKRDSTWYVLRKTIRRYKVPVVVAGLFLALLVGFSIGMWMLYRQVSAEAEKVSNINIFLEDTLGSVEPGPGEREVTVRAMLDEGVQWIGLVLSEQPEIEAAVRQIIGNGYRNIGLYEKADTHLTAALETRRMHFGDDDLEVARSLSALGHLRLDQGRVEEARRLFGEALRIRRQQLGHGSLPVAMSLGHLARAAERAGDLEEAESLQEQVLEIRRELLGADHPDTAMSMYNLARLRARRGKYAEAVQLHRAALAARRQALSPEHPDLARSLMALSLAHLQMSEPESARPLLEEALALRQRALPPGYWQIAESRSALGHCLALQERFAEAEPLLLEALQTLRRERGNEAAETREAAERLVACYMHWGRPEDADRYRH